MILVVGHKNPDSDSICSALVATELLKARGEEATPIRQGEINRETQHILEVAGADMPELRTSVAGEKFGQQTTQIQLKHLMTLLTQKSQVSLTTTVLVM